MSASLLADSTGQFTFDWSFFFRFVFHPSSHFLQGLLITVVVSVIAQTVAVLFGAVLAVGVMSKLLPLRWLAKLYIWFFRGTPLLVQLFLIYYGTPYLTGHDLFPISISIGPVSMPGALVAGTITLALNESAFMAEIIRGGILAVDAGQMEAAKSLGLTYSQGMRWIVFPQAARVIVPPLGNEFNAMLKNTSLLAVISIEEMFRVTQEVNSSTFKSFEVFLGVSVYYLALTTLWTLIQAGIERRLGKGQQPLRKTTASSRMFRFRMRHRDQAFDHA